MTLPDLFQKVENSVVQITDSNEIEVLNLDSDRALYMMTMVTSLQIIMLSSGGGDRLDVIFQMAVYIALR